MKDDEADPHGGEVGQQRACIVCTPRSSRSHSRAGGTRPSTIAATVMSAAYVAAAAWSVTGLSSCTWRA